MGNKIFREEKKFIRFPPPQKKKKIVNWTSFDRNVRYLMLLIIFRRKTLPGVPQIIEGKKELSIISTIIFQYLCL